MYLRLRQLCLVAERLDPVVDALTATFGVEVCHRDPEVGQFGLHNALLPFGTSFVEVVAPIAEGTAAGRYLERRKGDGGYMVILDSEELSRWRRHVAEIGVRIAAPLALGDYEGMQLHPRDTGGALLEINTTKNGADLRGPYWPAGPHWLDHVRTEHVSAITGAVLQSDNPRALAQKWGQILQRGVTADGNGFRIEVDNASLHFIEASDQRGEGLAGIRVQVPERGPVLGAAARLGIERDDQSVTIGGVRFFLQTEQASQE